jgi:hypothetical protein
MRFRGAREHNQEKMHDEKRWLARFNMHITGDNY